MFESLSELMVGVAVGGSLVGIAGVGLMMHKHHHDKKESLDDIVEQAPYHRLGNVLPVK